MSAHHQYESSDVTRPTLPDEYWLHLDAIQEVTGLMNATRLPTMALAAGTLSSLAAKSHEEIAHLLVTDASAPIESDAVLKTNAREFERIIPIGFTYGKLIARRSNELSGNPTLPSPRIKRARLRGLAAKMQLATAELDVHTLSGTDDLFSRLRDIELASTCSDILAFSLLGTQLHMRDEYKRHHRGEAALRSDEIRRMQVLLYAGALAGGLLNIDGRRLRKPYRSLMTDMFPDENLIV